MIIGKDRYRSATIKVEFAWQSGRLRDRFYMVCGTNGQHYVLGHPGAGWRV
jgi:hypothetical protein